MSMQYTHSIGSMSVPEPRLVLCRKGWNGPQVLGFVIGLIAILVSNIPARSDTSGPAARPIGARSRRVEGVFLLGQIEFNAPAQLVSGETQGERGIHPVRRRGAGGHRPSPENGRAARTEARADRRGRAERDRGPRGPTGQSSEGPHSRGPEPRTAHSADACPPLDPLTPPGTGNADGGARAPRDDSA